MKSFIPVFEAVHHALQMGWTSGSQSFAVCDLVTT